VASTELHILNLEESVLTKIITVAVTEQTPKELSTDSAVLRRFIQTNAVVVDKTPIIRKLLESTSSTVFLSRPRSFEKTRLLDTIQNIAEGKKKLFTEMEIGKDGSGYSWDTSPVIRLDFSGLPHEPEAFKRMLLGRMDRIIRLHDLNIEPVRHITEIENIIQKLSDKLLFLKWTQYPL
jgi:hypothetical protein